MNCAHVHAQTHGTNREPINFLGKTTRINGVLDLLPIVGQIYESIMKLFCIAFVSWCLFLPESKTKIFKRGWEERRDECYMDL